MFFFCRERVECVLVVPGGEDDSDETAIFSPSGNRDVAVEDDDAAVRRVGQASAFSYASSSVAPTATPQGLRA